MTTGNHLSEQEALDFFRDDTRGKDHFDNEPEDVDFEEVETPPEQEDDEPEQEVTETVTDKEDEDLGPPEDISEMLIDMFDMLQSFIYPLAYNYLLFEKDEIAKLKLVANKIKTDRSTTITVTEEEAALIKEKLADAEDYADDVPFKDKEKKMIHKQLTRVVKQMNIRMNPKAGLWFAIGLTSFSRVVPLFQLWAKKKFARK